MIEQFDCGTVLQVRYRLYEKSTQAPPVMLT